MLYIRKGRGCGRVNAQWLQETHLGKHRSERTLDLLSTHPTDSYPIYSVLTTFTQQPIEYVPGVEPRQKAGRAYKAWEAIEDHVGHSKRVSKAKKCTDLQSASL